MHIEKIGGKEINVLDGLELYTNVFGRDNQIEIVNCIYELQQRGQNGQLKGIFRKTSFFNSLLYSYTTK